MCLSVSGNYETYTLSHPSWWDRLQPRWPSGAGALTFLCVSTRQKTPELALPHDLSSNLPADFQFWGFIPGTKGVQQPYQLVSYLGLMYFFDCSSYNLLGNLIFVFTCSCSYLLCTSCCCPGRTIHKVWWDVGDILQPWRAHISRQCPCAGAAQPPREGQELHVLLLSCTCSGAFWVVGVCHLPCCFWWMFMNLGSLVTSVVTWHRVAWCP